MELKRLTGHIWYMPFETERDRPNLGYVKGENWSLAIDAGHSAAHTKEFYALLEKENLPLPSMTVLTHWHWDHTFGMHAVNGLCIANAFTGLSGCLLAQSQKSVNIDIGTGMVTIALASLLIGRAFMGRGKIPSSSGIPPVRNSVQGKRTGPCAGSFLIRSGESTRKSVLKDTGFRQTQRIHCLR